MRGLIILYLLMIYSIFFPCITGLAWDDKFTHRELTKYAAESSVLRACNDVQDQKCNYLKNLGLGNGLAEILEWSGNSTIEMGRIEDWLQEGAMLEDYSGLLSIGYIDGKGRSFNHFHNALKKAPWLDAGLDDEITLTLPLPPYYVAVPLTGESAILWAQDVVKQEDSYGGNWSWGRTRGYFYAAVTGKDTDGSVVAPDEPSRKEYFARTFRGLGHQMHLLQDMAVPYHVRNDAHPEDAYLGKSPINGSRYFETWTKDNSDFVKCLLEDHGSLSPYVLSNCQQYHLSTAVDVENFFPAVSLDASNYGLSPITQFFDTDQYDGTNVSSGVDQGLSEYTNANFFSNDTIFAAERYTSDHRRYFPFPRKTSTDLASFIAGTKPSETIVGKDGNTVTGVWISKIADGENVSHFARTSSYSKLVYNIFGEGAAFYNTIYEDEKCHEDYAKLLIPRAVGYSAALLDYFFRGNIEITLPAGGVYSATDDANAGFTRITLLAQDKTSNNDDMSNGTIDLVVKYRLATSDPFKSGPLQTTDYSYKVFRALYNVNSIPIKSPVELSFNLTEDPLPVNAVDVSLLVVYHGKLGMEDGAVAVGFKDISDPTPIDIYNNMDKICINGSWYDAGSLTAILQVDINGDGIAYGTNEWDVYPHNLNNIYITFYGDTGEPVYATPGYHDYEITDIPVQGFRRAVYVLGDDDFHYSFSVVREGTDQNDYWTHEDPALVYNGYTIKNQVEDPPIFFDFRGYSMWAGSGFIYINRAYPEGSQCDLSLLQ